MSVRSQAHWPAGPISPSASTTLTVRQVLLAAFLGAIAVRRIESTLVDLLGDYWILALGLVLMASVVLLPKGLIATPLERFGRR